PDVDALVPKDLVQVLTLTGLVVTQDEHTRQRELAAGELALAAGANGNGVGRDEPAADLCAGPRVDDRDTGVQDGAFTEHRTFADARSLRHHAAAADERVVLDDDWRGLRRLEHAADADAPGQVHVGADLRARPHGRPCVDHRVRTDAGA